MLEVHVLALPGNAWRLVLPPSGADAGLAWMRQVAIAFEAHVQAMASGHAFWLAGPRAAEVLEKAGVPAPRDGAFKEIAVREGDAFLRRKAGRRACFRGGSRIALSSSTRG